jgi:hypothetical protein
MCSHWQDVSAAGGERSVGGGRRRTRRCAPAHRRAQAPGARRRGSAQRAARLPAPPAAPQATQAGAGRASARRLGRPRRGYGGPALRKRSRDALASQVAWSDRAARPERERSGVGDGVEHHQSISSCSCVPAEDRWAPGRTPAHQREHDPRRMSRASRGSQRVSQVAHTMADEQTGELLRLKVPQGYVYAPLGRHATLVLPAITGDRVLVRQLFDSAAALRRPFPRAR